MRIALRQGGGNCGSMSIMFEIIVMAQGAERHDGQALFECLKADVRPVKVEPQRGVESQARIASHHQQQLVKSRD
jgi:hypothetical protein